MRRSIASIMVVLLLMSSVMAFAQDGGAPSNKEAVQNAVADTQDGNWDSFLALFPDQFQMNPGEPYLADMSKAEVNLYIDTLRAGIPDLSLEAHTILAQDDWAVAELTYTGTFTGSMNFFGTDLEPSNEVVSWTEMDFIRFEDGHIVEMWTISNPMAMFSQLGFFPPSEGEDSGTPAELPAGYQALSADELAATYTSGNEERNLALFQEMVDLGPMGDTSSAYSDPYISWQSGVPYLEAASMEDFDFFGFLASAMPDLTFETPVVVAEGDWVAVLLNVSGTFTEDVDFFGTPLTATDEPFLWQIGIISRYDADGTIVEEFVESDDMQLLGALGLMDGE